MLYDLIIIGAGPAGMTAAIYAARQKIKALLVTKDFGGQMAKKSVAIENYPGMSSVSGLELIAKFKTHLDNQEAEVLEDEIKQVKKNENSFFVLTKNNKELQSKTVIIATGADSKVLGVKGEKEFAGKGVSYCAVCDGAVFSGKTVAVIGGGNAGFETAIFLVNLAKKIYVLEYDSQIKADKENQDTVAKIDKIEIVTNAQLKEIKGDRFVNSIVYQDRKEKKEKVLKVEGVFVEIGYEPKTSFVKDLVDFNKEGEIKVNLDDLQTKTKGLFAAGDVTEGKFKQIVIACGQGAKAALSAYNYIKKA